MLRHAECPYRDQGSLNSTKSDKHHILPLLISWDVTPCHTLLNSRPPDHDSTLYVTETHSLTTRPSIHTEIVTLRQEWVMGCLPVCILCS